MILPERNLRAGDAVECIDMTQPINAAFPPVATVLKWMGVYRVASVCETRIGQIVEIVGIKPWLWERRRFRLIDDGERAPFVAALRHADPVRTAKAKAWDDLKRRVKLGEISRDDVGVELLRLTFAARRAGFDALRWGK